MDTTFTLRYRPAADDPAAEEKHYTLDHAKVDWADVCNRAFEKHHPGKPFITPAWLKEKYK